MSFILVLFLANAEIATFPTSKAICFETLEAHRQGSVVIAWDREGKQWTAENVWCLEPVEQDSAESPTS
jgi:hypothetical protein